MHTTEHKTLALELFQALQTQDAIPPLTQRYPNITIDDAYHISLAMLEQRQQQLNEQVIGKKIGVTSAVVQDMLGVHQPDFGFLTQRMCYPNGATVAIAQHLIAPRAEGEIAFKLKHSLNGPGVTEEAVLAATQCIMPCFEIVDSRIKNWQIKIQDTIADNASCGVFTLGDASADPNDFDLPNLHMQVFKNNTLISEGKGSAVQGNPLTAVAWLANTLGHYGVTLNAGDIILSGSLVPLEPVIAGDQLRLSIEGLGSAAINFS